MNKGNKIIVGEEYVFSYLFEGDADGDLPDYNGLPCTVMNMKSEDAQYDNLYEVMFDNGSEFNVYGMELRPCHNGLIVE
jgi:hypothetical protein